MDNVRRENNQTDLQSAYILHAGSGDIHVAGGFAPSPTAPVNGSNLPHRYPDFVGRHDEIKRVMQAFLAKAWVVTITGMGGMGKTTLALEIAHLCKERTPQYPEIPEFAGYIWTSARGKSSFALDDVLTAILHVLNPLETIKRTLSREEKLLFVTQYLSSKSYLLIIDNFESINDDDLSKFLADIPGSGKVLATSRHQLGIPQVGEVPVTLGGLEENDAVNLLQLEAERLQIPLTRADHIRLRFIARKAYGIPFVLRWVMERVYGGMLLESVLRSLEQATADDIFVSSQEGVAMERKIGYT